MTALSPAAHITTALTPRMERGIRIGSTVAVLLVFLAALTLSWNGLTELAIAAGFTPSLAWLMPVAIDGTVVAGALNTLHSSLTGKSTLYGWSLTIVGALVSTWGNVAAAGGGDFTTQVVHALAPLSLAASLHALTSTAQHRIGVAQAEAERLAQEEAQRRAEEEAAQERARKEAEKAERRAQAMEARKAAAPASGGQVEAMARIIEQQPEGTSVTDIVMAVLEVFPKPAAADLALALGKSDSPEDVRSAAKAMERARAKSRKMKAEAQAASADDEEADQQPALRAV